MPLGVISIRRHGFHDVEICVNATVGDCRLRCAKVWGCPLRRIVLRTPDQVLLDIDDVVLRQEMMLTGSETPYTVAVEVMTMCSSGTSGADQNPVGTFIARLPRSDQAVLVSDLQAYFERHTQLAHSAFMFHQVDNDADPSDNGDCEPDNQESRAGGEDELVDLEEEPGVVSSPPPSPTFRKEVDPLSDDGLDEDQGFQQIIQLRAASMAAARSAQAAATAVADAAKHVRPTELLETAAQKWMEKDKHEQCLASSTEAQVHLSAVHHLCAIAGTEASNVESNVPEVEACLAEARADIEERKVAFAEAKEEAKVASKALQQARIARKKIAEALATSKAADEKRDAQSQELARRKVSEETAQLKVPLTAQSASRARESAAKAAAICAVVEASALKAAAYATAANQAAIDRAEAWKEESLESEMQAYGGPLLTDALKPDDDLGERQIRRVLCRLRPRAARLLQELECRNELWNGMGAGQSVGSKHIWIHGIDHTRSMFVERLGMANGDLFFQAETPWLWNVALRGPRGCPYEDIFFWMHLEIPSGWPRHPPRVRFKTPIYHLNISEDGQIHPLTPALRSIEEKWTRDFSIFQFLGAVAAILCAPHFDSASRVDLKTQFFQDPDQYKQDAAEHAKRVGCTIITCS